MTLARKLFLAGVLAGALAVTATGCGDDDKETSKPPTPSFDIRPGTWSMEYTSTWTGADSCVAREPDSGTYPDTVLCSFDVVGEGSSLFQCEEPVVEGNRTTFSCTALLEDLDPCKFEMHLEGEATVSDTTLAITARMWLELTGPENPCNLYETLYDHCTQNLEITGHWVSADGAEQCGDSTAAPSMRGLLETVATEAFARR